MKRKTDFLFIIGRLAFFFGALFLLNLFFGLFFFGIFYWFLFVCVLLSVLLIIFFAGRRTLINSLKKRDKADVIDVEGKVLSEEENKRGKHE